MLGISLYSSYLFTNNGTMEQWASILETGSELKDDDIEQYTRRQNFRISGIKENEDENTDSIVVNFVQNTMKIDLDIRDIDRSHRMGRPN